MPCFLAMAALKGDEARAYIETEAAMAATSNAGNAGSAAQAAEDAMDLELARPARYSADRTAFHRGQWVRYARALGVRYRPTIATDQLAYARDRVAGGRARASAAQAAVGEASSVGAR